LLAFPRIPSFKFREHIKEQIAYVDCNNFKADNDKKPALALSNSQIIIERDPKQDVEIYAIHYFVEKLNSLLVKVCKRFKFYKQSLNNQGEY
jgi:hypothetical protein